MLFSTVLTLVAIWLTSTLAFPTPELSDEPNRRFPGTDLTRRSNRQPSGRKLTWEEYRIETVKKVAQIETTLRKDVVLRAKVSTGLGLDHNEWSLYDLDGIRGPNVSPEEVNNALRQAGYQGELLPELHEAVSYSDGQIQAFLEETMRIGLQLQLAVQRDPGLLRKFRVALGLDPDGFWPLHYVPRSEFNRAMRKAGYQGPLFPVNPGEESDEWKDDRGSSPIHGDDPNRASLDRGPPQLSFQSGTMQTLGDAFRKKLVDIIRPMTSRLHGPQSPSKPPSLLPLKVPLSPLRLIM